MSSRTRAKLRDRGVRVKVDVRPHSKDGRAIVDVEGIAHTTAPAALVARVIQDYGAYDKFLPRVLNSESEQDPGGFRVRMVVDTPFPVRDLVTETHNVHMRCPDGRWLILWTHLGGDLPDNRGVTSIHRARGGGTIVRQRAVVSTRLGLPHEVIGRGLRRYYHHLLMATREQALRALEQGWYGQFSP